MILNDREIRRLCLEENMIVPFSEHMGKEQDVAISYGLSSFGYDIRLADTYEIFDPASEIVTVDPIDFPKQFLRRHVGNSCRIMPGGFVLAHSLETFIIPDDVLVTCYGKSTYARCALVVNVTPFEPGWRGVATLELSNTSPLPLRVYSGLGIAQLRFDRGERPEVTYGDRKGKYQNQTGITPPRTGKEE